MKMNESPKPAKLDGLKKFEVELEKNGYRLDHRAGIHRAMDMSQIGMVDIEVLDAEGKTILTDPAVNPRLPKIKFDSATIMPIEALLRFLNFAKKYGTSVVVLSRTNAPLALVIPRSFESKVIVEDENKEILKQLGKITFFQAPRVEFEGEDTTKAGETFSKYIPEGSSLTNHPSDNEREALEKEEKMKKAEALRKEAEALEKGL